jgi:NAD(P)-dependent dehydrogenase (short-subunit alcohol dehydrogenase family)
MTAPSPGGGVMSARVALVTGGTGGIGTAIVHQLAMMGH